VVAVEGGINAASGEEREGYWTAKWLSYHVSSKMCRDRELVRMVLWYFRRAVVGRSYREIWKIP
jgi:hypothetical protein